MLTTGVFGTQCYAGFDRNSWVAGTNETHRRDVREVQKSETKTDCQRREREYMDVDSLVCCSFLTLTL